ncbi:MAG: hypothetical protein IID44_10445 [Planctomycetes bacterium]|nr:hypothetical protein [Planctomycetota bacterium]
MPPVTRAQTSIEKFGPGFSPASNGTSIFCVGPCTKVAAVSLSLAMAPGTPRVTPFSTSPLPPATLPMFWIVALPAASPSRQ